MAETASETTEKLIIEATICPECGATLPTAVSRGMLICGRDGEEIGKVAAILVNGRSQEPTHLVLTHRLPEYRLVPLNQILAISETSVTLSLSAEALSQLPLHIPKL